MTETSLVEDRIEVAQSLQSSKAQCIKLAMGYGSGYSSMTNLRRYPSDRLKIDRSYVTALDKDPVAGVIVDRALALGRGLGLTVVVEGIETEEQRALIASKGPDLMQGFLFGWPEKDEQRAAPKQLREPPAPPEIIVGILIGRLLFIAVEQDAEPGQPVSLSSAALPTREKQAIKEGRATPSWALFRRSSSRHGRSGWQYRSSRAGCEACW